MKSTREKRPERPQQEFNRSKITDSQSRRDIANLLGSLPDFAAVKFNARPRAVK